MVFPHPEKSFDILAWLSSMYILKFSYSFRAAFLLPSPSSFKTHLRLFLPSLCSLLIKYYPQYCKFSLMWECYIWSRFRLQTGNAQGYSLQCSREHVVPGMNNYTMQSMHTGLLSYLPGPRIFFVSP